MKRMPRTFYEELCAIRDQFGEVEYDRDQILPAVMSLLKQHTVTENELLRDAANAFLDRAEKAEDVPNIVGQTCLFDFGAQVALGDHRRIRRGRMNTEQIRRRKRVIDHNKVAQDAAWAHETQWLNTASDHLEGRPLSTLVEDVMAPPPGHTGSAGTGASA